jgi:serine phosphatase RsbU (regulator of sigma subunit)
VRLLACAYLAVALFSLRRRPGGTFRVLAWCALSFAAAWAAGRSGAPWNPALVLALLVGLSIRRYLAPWVGSRSTVSLALLAVAGLVPLAVGFAFGWGVVVRDTLLVRLDRAAYTLAESWVLLAGARACAELLRRWIRRASVRTKLIVSFGIFAVTPALLAFLYAVLSGWIHAGELRASALERHLELTSGGRGLVERAQRAPAPSGAGALRATIERERPVLEDRRLSAAVLERRGDAWHLAGQFGGPDSLFIPAAAPVADSGGVVRGLALRAGRIWWVETALWAHGRDSLALQTFEPVDSTRLNGFARLFRCDPVLFTSRSMSSSKTQITIGDQVPRGMRRITTGGGAIQIDTDSPVGRASPDSALADSFAVLAAVTMAGGGSYSATTSLRQLHGRFNGGASPPCFVWTGSGWRLSAAVLLVRSSFREGIVLSGLGTGPFPLVVKIVLLLFAGLFLLVEAVSLVVGSRVAGLITRGAASLQAAAASIGRGDFSARVQVPSQDELGELAASFNRMAEGLEEGQRAMLEREQMRRELELARRIQSRLLPPGPPELPRLDVAAVNAMSQQVGGDYYDFVPLPDGRLGLCIADVAGKGVAAALLMSNVKAALVSSASVESAPRGITTRVNRLLEQSIEPGRFVTFFFASLDHATLRMEYVNAGHPAPILLRAGGAVERLTEGGTILGIDAGAAFESGSVTLAPGDLLALFTDGVTEAQGEGDELFGEERIESLLRAGQTRPAAEVLDRLVAAVKTYEGDRGQSDDLTAILVKAREDTSGRAGSERRDRP